MTHGSRNWRALIVAPIGRVIRSDSVGGRNMSNGSDNIRMFRQIFRSYTLSKISHVTSVFVVLF